MLLSARDDLFQKLEEYGWAIDGSTANVLHIGKSPVDLRLEARLIVVNLGNNDYLIQGLLQTRGGEEIARYLRISREYKLLGDLARIIGGDLESYFTGNTNKKHIKEIREKYKIR